jgi:hypothetical protein
MTYAFIHFLLTVRTDGNDRSLEVYRLREYRGLRKRASAFVSTARCNSWTRSSTSAWSGICAMRSSVSVCMTRFFAGSPGRLWSLSPPVERGEHTDADVQHVGFTICPTVHWRAAVVWLSASLVAGAGTLLGLRWQTA